MVRLAAFLAGFATLAFPAGAVGEWSRPRTLETGRPSPYAAPAVAVAGRGDAAVAWETVRGFPPRSQNRSCALTPSRAACYPIVSVKVAVLTANELLVTRTLWSQRANPTMKLSVAVAKGEVTVAWGYYELNGGSESARVAYGPLKGRWQPSRLLAHFSDLWVTGGRTPAYPQLALAPDGQVLAAWSACRSASACRRPTGGVALAWRAPGHGFGPSRLVAAAPEGAVPAYDRAGTTYLDSPCSARVVLAEAGSRSFARVVTLTRGPVSDLSLSLSGADEGLASWVAGACSTDQAVGNAPGPVLASILKETVFAAPVMLTRVGERAYESRSAAVPGGGVVSWVTNAANGTPRGTVTTVGSPGPLAPIPPESAPVVADGGGDILFTPTRLFPTPGARQFVLPRRGAPVQFAPSEAGVLAAAPFARLAAVAWFAKGPALKLSVWRSELLP